jgi:T-complex protein 1 subunit theta
MALKIPTNLGLTGMLKEGFKHYQGFEEAVFRNIQACKQLSDMTRTSMGPNGMNKMVINHLEKLSVTNDAAAMIKELEIYHPAAKILVMASQQQEQEIGDGTNFVMILAGELLQKGENLLVMGLHPSEIVKFLEENVMETITDLHNEKALKKSIRSAISSKQYGYEDVLADLVTRACLNVMPKNPKHFNVDNIRVVKIMGASIYNSVLLNGMVFNREPEGTVKRVEKAKLAIFTCPIEVSKTETKGTVLIHNANEMLNFNKDEEKCLDEEFRRLAEAGVKMVVSGGNVSDLCLHFINRWNLMCVKVLSKFDLRRLCKVTGATPLARIGTPTPEEMGYVDLAEVIEIGSDRCTIFRQEEDQSQVSTIIVRGSSRNTMDDIERAIDDGVNVVKTLTKDPRLVAGAGAIEIELAKRLTEAALTAPGLEQYAIKKYAEALEVIPRTLAENAGMNSTEIISRLYAAHQENNRSIGVDIENETTGVCDAVEKRILDPLANRHWAICFAANAANTVLAIDQIIMSKPAGGPKPKDNPNWDEEA